MNKERKTQYVLIEKEKLDELVKANAELYHLLINSAGYELDGLIPTFTYNSKQVLDMGTYEFNIKRPV